MIDPISILIPLFLFVTGLGVGVLSGMIGIGGGLLVIPFLLYLYPWLFPQHGLFDMKAVTGIAATQSLASSVSSFRAHIQRKNIHWPLITTMGMFSVAGGYLGGFSSSFFSEWSMKIFYVCLLTAIVVLFFKNRGSQQPEPDIENPTPLPPMPDDPPPTEPAYHRKHPWGIVGVSLGIGYSAGILGIGGAVFLMPLMHHVLGVPLRLAIGTTTGIMALTCLAGFLGKLQTAMIPFPEALIVSLGAIIGAYFGVKLSFKTSEKTLMAIFISFISLTLIRVLIELALGR